jgi:long-chain acyl-CoA synthetase
MICGANLLSLLPLYVTAATSADDYHAKPTGVGQPSLGIEAIVVEPSTGVKLTEVGAKGELWIRGPGRAKGYWNRKEATEEAFLADGWFRTGDVAYIDADGCIFIVDRVKDIIIRGGENISTGQVENAIYNHKDVLDCAVVALPEPSLGERVAAVCVISQGVPLPSPKDVIAAAAKSLPRYAVPEYVWVRREPLEKNQNGKTLKKAVQAEVIARAQKEGFKPQSRESKM